MLAPEAAGRAGSARQETPDGLRGGSPRPPPSVARLPLGGPESVERCRFAGDRPGRVRPRKLCPVIVEHPRRLGRRKGTVPGSVGPQPSGGGTDAPGRAATGRSGHGSRRTGPRRRTRLPATVERPVARAVAPLRRTVLLFSTRARNKPRDRLRAVVLLPDPTTRPRSARLRPRAESREEAHSSTSRHP